MPELVLPPIAKRYTCISYPLRKGVLLLGDFLFLNLALFISRSLSGSSFEVLGVPYGGVFVLNANYGFWLLIFYSAGLYDIERFGVPRVLIKRLFEGVGVAGFLSLCLFYALSIFTVEAKFTLFVSLAIAAILLYGWRRVFVHWGRNGHKARVLLCGEGPELQEFREFLQRNAHLGYQPVNTIKDIGKSRGVGLTAAIVEKVTSGQVDMLAVTQELSGDEVTRGFLYQLLRNGIHVVDVSYLCEELTGKIPNSLITEGWFIDNLREFNKRGFEVAKRAVDLLAAIALGLPTLLIFPLVALAIKTDSPGPVLFRQERVGKDGGIFDLTKFRTMVADAEKEGARWATAGDSRITRVGVFLRRTRIDELPQLWSVLKGEMAFIGPRPERPEFVTKLSEIIPFYEMRHLVKPGITGWAQINFRYGSSIEDAKEKLRYDLYYIKNRSLSLELSILLKTASTTLRYEGR